MAADQPATGIYLLTGEESEHVPQIDGAETGTIAARSAAYALAGPTYSNALGYTSLNILSARTEHKFDSFTHKQQYDNPCSNELVFDGFSSRELQRRGSGVLPECRPTITGSLQEHHYRPSCLQIRIYTLPGLWACLLPLYMPSS